MITIHVLTPSSLVVGELKVYCAAKVNEGDPNIRMISADQIDYYILRDFVGHAARLPMPEKKDEKLEELLRDLWALGDRWSLLDEELCKACAMPAKEHRMILERIGG